MRGVRAHNDTLICAPTDLSNYLACAHLTSLDRAVTLGERPKPRTYDDPGAEAVRKRGQEHEARVLEDFRARGLAVEEIPDTYDPEDYEAGWRAGADLTRQAMRRGVDVIYQGRLYDGRWGGYPDFLVRVGGPSDPGDFSYEVVDAKLARAAKGGAVLQIALYSDLLAAAQGVRPEHMHLALGRAHGELETFRFDEYAAYYRSVRRRFEEHLASPPETYPEPVSHCQICHWQQECDARRRADDHLSLVAGITRNQRRRLVEHGVDTLQRLAELDLEERPRVEGIDPVPLRRIREQARVQAEGARLGRPVHELIEPAEVDRGLAILPEPSAGDLFFDIEGDPYALEDGLEYLLGWADRDGEYHALWALSREEEKRAFERFMDMVMERWERYPDLHIYHYAPYETTAVKKLAGRHATREDEVDRLLRGKVFVDLHRAVRQGVRASVESYSIKKIEPFYGYEREVELRGATAALAQFEAWLEMREAREAASDAKGVDGPLPHLTDEDRELLGLIEGYNRDDCLSTWRLAEWLEGLRPELEKQTGSPVPRPTPGDPDPSENLLELLGRVGELYAALTSDVPADPAERDPDQQARWILANLLEFHRREQKSMWWEYYTRLDMTDEELIEDRGALGGLEYEGVVGTVKRSLVHRYRFPPQEHQIDVGDKPRDPATGSRCGEVVAVDHLGRTIDLKRGKGSTTPHPRALIPLNDIRHGVLRDSLMRLAEHVVAEGFEEGSPHRAALDLLRRLPPRVGQDPGSPLAGEDDDTLAIARDLALRLDGTVLPLQGPPGTGKTYTGARMIVSLLREGKRVGVTANSHKVISNLLRAVCDAADEEGLEFRGVQKADIDVACPDDRITICAGNREVEAALGAGVSLAAGTAWLWSRPDFADAVDVLFVDEAGQMSLANTLAVSQAAGSLVLLGDPQQLDQPLQGAHPPGTDVSALGHLLGEEQVIPAERGLFLPRTWRMHPDVCAFTSEQFYRGRLRPRPELAVQDLLVPEPLRGTGLRLLPVEHTGNQNASEEEAERIARLLEAVLAADPAWVDADGNPHPLHLEDVLIVAPYNAQVSAIAALLPEGARVGTVDKFQGQEAPVVLYSMATSTPEDAPRGMEFLYSLNRLNVATSRARCLAAIVASPDIFAPECRTPRQMRLANAFCRFVEMAE